MEALHSPDTQNDQQIVALKFLAEGVTQPVKFGFRGRGKGSHSSQRRLGIPNWGFPGELSSIPTESVSLFSVSRATSVRHWQRGRMSQSGERSGKSVTRSFERLKGLAPGSPWTDKRNVSLTGLSQHAHVVNICWAYAKKKHGFKHPISGDADLIPGLWCNVGQSAERTPITWGLTPFFATSTELYSFEKDVVTSLPPCRVVGR